MYSRRRESSLASEDAATAPLRGPKPGGKRVALPPLPNIRENVYMESRPLPSLPEEYAAREFTMATASPRHRNLSTGSGSGAPPTPQDIDTQSVVVSVHAKPPSGPCSGPSCGSGCGPSTGSCPAPPEVSGRYHQPIDCVPAPQLRPQKKPLPPRRLTPQASTSGGPPPPRVFSASQQHPPPQPIIEDPAYFVLDPDAESGLPQPPRTLFSAHMQLPLLTNTPVGFSSDKQKSPEEENADNVNKEEAAHNSCQDLPCAPHLQKLDPTKGNSSWP